MDAARETVEAQIGEWLAFMHRRRELSDADAAELEDHLRARMDDLVSFGLEPDEAFLVAVKRLGSLDALTREFAREHSDRLWRQLVLDGGGQGEPAGSTRALLVVVAWAVAAAVLVKVPALFGLGLDDHPAFYARNAGVFGLVPLVAYFAWRRAVSRPTALGLALTCAVGVAAANAYPLHDDAPVTVLTALHLPLALWLTVGVAYVGGDWRSASRRMDFIRFTGEWVVYYALIALGGGVLTVLTAGAFKAIGVRPDVFVGSWLLPCGAAGAVVVAAWLVEAKQSVVENIAPVLTKVFTPLFVATLAAFLGGVLWTRTGIDVDRDALILFDLVLAVVVGLVLYALSAREPAAGPDRFDLLQLALVVAALLVDVLVLVALAHRIGEFGFSANKTAALGENLLLLTNLGVSAYLLTAFVRHRAPVVRLERWQTGYLAVYAAWTWTVVLVFPPVFGFS
ncbi:permease prefix domain 1-containing protein [Nocardioides pocheonensis]|uniref:DUF4153 domain-containing protein n=1 Tax=Nocardioides pocheonensis TaxID=661485 RepID=A0A3N0GRA4_9ACTN|nr:permease prefix domain 1-containing protein [Nocardioides pocheonensis]RNM14941.1 hypothetical protein EFL26_09475 [Nocardioides pocheonensis]